MNQTRFIIIKNFFSSFYLFLVLQLASTSFSNYNDSIISSGFLITKKQTTFLTLDFKDTYGIGFWSMSIPLQIPKKNVNFDIPFDVNQQETGELLLLVKDFDTNDNIIVVSKILDYPNKKVQHMIKFIDAYSSINFFFNFNSLEYEGSWIFHLISIQPLEGMVIVQVSDQSKQSQIWFSQVEQNLKIIQGGRGYINGQNLNTFRGLLSKLIFLPSFMYSEIPFLQIQIENQIPEKFNYQQQIWIIPNYQKFDGYQTPEIVIDQYGKKYCLSGWVKYNFQNIEEDKYTLIRMTSLSNYEDKKKLGDELFSFEVLFSKIQPQNTKIVVHADAYSMPVQQSFQQQYDLTFQGVQNDKYNVVESTRTLQYLEDFRYYEGLQQWHFVMYEYGRSKLDEKMFLQIHFFNQLGWIKEKLGNDIFRGSFINSRFNIFFGGDNFNHNFLQAEVYDFKIDYNYQQDQRLTLYCHYSCFICKGPQSNDCLLCFEEFTNRYFQSEVSMCKCKQGYFDYGQMICTDQYYSVQLQEVGIQNPNICPLGYFRLPINSTNYECRQCPQKMTSQAILCAECYFFQKTWYLKPICKQDFIRIKDTQDPAFHLVARNSINYDLYSIDLDRELVHHAEFEDYCVYDAITKNSCYTFSYYHLGSFAQMKCKNNYYIGIETVRCYKYKSYCPKYDSFGNCEGCFPGKYLIRRQCEECPLGCSTCENQYNQPVCLTCLKQYNFIDGQCKMCGQYCEFCQSYYDDQLEQQYLRCLKCIDNSKYHVSLDGKNCLFNQIQNCVHAFQALSDDMTINTLDLLFQPQLNQNQIVTLCAKCETSYVFVFEIKKCVKDITEQNCQVGIGQLNEIDQSLKSIICLSSTQYTNQIVQFTDTCQSYNTNCQVCIQTDIIGSYACLDCIKGYYISQPSSKCLVCPLELKCKTCYSQNSILKDRWKLLVRSFYRKYIEANNFHQYIVYGQSQKSQDYEVICSTCIDGYKLHDNICLEFCSETCIECIFQIDKYICNKCLYEERGRRLTLINNQCIECPENCALCRIRTNEEIQLINPLFNNPKYYKYTYQCIKSYEDQIYYYDEDFGLFVECKQNDQSNGCYRKLIISLNLYVDSYLYKEDLANLPDEESRTKFKNENVLFDTLLISQSSFKEFENDKFYSYANSKLIKTIVIKLKSKKKISKNIWNGGFIKQRFQENIFTVQNVEIEFIFELETILLPQFDLEFINFHKITLQNIMLSVTEESKFIFKSYFPQTIILNDITFQIDNEYNNHNVNFSLIFQNVSTLLVSNLYCQNVSFISNDYFMTIQETSYPKLIIFKNITVIQSRIKTIFLDLQLGDQDYVEIDTVNIQSNITNSNFIKVSQSNENGQLKLFNVILTSQIYDSRYVFDFEKVLHLEITNFQMFQTILINTTLILLNRNSYFENLKFTNNQFLTKSIGIINNNNFLYQNINQKFTNVFFEDNQYDNLIQFIFLKKYSSYTQNITINYLKQINNYFIKDSLNQYRKQVDYSLITIQYDYVKISNIIIERGFGVNDITLYDCLEIIIENGTFQQEKYRFLGLHKYLSCQLQQVNAQYYSTTLNIASSKVTELKNLTFSKVLSYNFPIIAIYSADQKLTNQSETIILQDILFSSNLILFTEMLFQTSLISISSNQQSNIQINNITFKNNVYNQYTQFDLTITAGLLLIDCSYCQIYLMNSYFQNNIVLNSRSSIMYIQTQKLQISNCIFHNNSIFIYQVLQPHIYWGFTSQVSEQVIKSIFQSKSNSGIGELQAEQILIQNNSFINSSGLIGGCFSIFSYGSSDILILNNRFQEISTKFLKDLEYGGAIYIDGSSSSSLNIQLNDNIGDKIFCRGLGGFIYLKSNTSSSNLTVSNLHLEDIYAQQGSAIYVSYSKFVESPQVLFVQNVLVSNTEIGYLEFLSKFIEFSNQQEIRYLINNRSIVYLEFGSLIQINEFYISNITLESFLILQETKFVYLSGIQVQNSYISNNLISVQSFTTTNQEITLQNSVFKSIQIGFNLTNDTNITCVNLNPVSNNILYQCLNDFTQAPNLLTSNEQQGYYNKAFCVYQEIISYIDQQNSGLFLFNDCTQQDKIQINSITLIEIFCTLCQNGLIYLQFQPSTSFIQQQLISSLYVQNCSCGNQGCLNVVQLPNNNANRLINQQELHSLNYELKIQYYICQYNIATQGTCLRINSLQTLLQNSLFQFNEAVQEGGSIYVKGNKKLIIEDTVIQFNKGSIGGGLYFSDQVAMNLLNNKTKILKNTAQSYGNNVASNPQQLTIQIKKNSQVLSAITKISNSTLKIQEIQIKPYFGFNGKLLEHIYLPTGQEISSYHIFDWKNELYAKSNLIFRILALDGDLNIIQNLENSECVIESRRFDEQKKEESDFTNNYTNIQQISFNQVTQSYNLDDLIVYFDNSVPKDIVLQLQFSCNSIKVPIYNSQYPYEITNYHQNYKLRLNVKTYQCQLGEIKNITSFSCEKCDPDQGLYSLTLNQQKCDTKDELTTLSIKNNQLVLRAGYWRPYFDTKAIHYCLNLQGNCLGGIKVGDNSCYIGHIGALCEQCDLYNLRGNGQYSIVKKFSCGPCIEKDRNVFVVIGVIILTLIFLLISIQGSKKTMEEFKKSSVFKIYRYQVYLNKNQSGTLIKMLTNYFQIIVSITTFQLQFSAGLNNTLNVVGNPLQTSSYSLDCFLVDLKDLQIEYSRMIWQIILPLVYIMVFIWFYFIAIVIQKGQFNPSIATIAAIYIYIYTQPNLINGFIELISYRNISGFKWIQANVSQRYDTTTHTLWMLQFCLPLITLISIIIPCFFFFGLYTNKNHFGKKSVMSHWGYLYNEYKKEAYFWELIKIIEKELIILSLVYYEDTIVVKGVLVLFITYVYQELNAFYQPYQLINLNQLDYYSANISMITIGLAIGTYISQQVYLEELQIPFYCIMAFQNILFLIKIISKIIFEYSKQYEVFIDKIKEIIRQRIPKIDEYPFMKRLFKSRIQQRKNAILMFKKLRNFGIPLAKKIIQMRQENFDQKDSEGKLPSTYNHCYLSSNKEVKYQQKLLNIKSFAKNI